MRQIRKIAQNPILATEVEAVLISNAAVEFKGPKMSPVSYIIHWGMITQDYSSPQS